MKAKTYDPAALERYLANLEIADRNRAHRIEALKHKLDALLQRERELRAQLDTMIADVNQLRRRRHHAIGISWRIDPRTINRSYTQPSGPAWFQLVHGRNNTRHLKRIRRITLTRIKESYQGRDAGVLRRLYRQVSVLTDERNRLLRTLDRVVKNLRYVTLPGIPTAPGEHRPI